MRIFIADPPIRVKEMCAGEPQQFPQGPLIGPVQPTLDTRNGQATYPSRDFCWKTGSNLRAWAAAASGVQARACGDARDLCSARCRCLYPCRCRSAGVSAATPMGRGSGPRRRLPGGARDEYRVSASQRP